ncbi:uncharacterized protein [Primulina eburnea]|uniref:uncharacterized protein isoform X2 n=1 Tax=Primulina eburnea TaxID=1245227 RepID=UPI003C6BD92B
MNGTWPSTSATHWLPLSPTEEVVTLKTKPMSPTPTVATAPPLSYRYLSSLHHNPSSTLTSPLSLKSFRSEINRGPTLRILLRRPHASISTHHTVSGSNAFDPELRSVLELATDSELYELERILFGPSYFSPLLKSITRKAEVDYVMISEDPDERDNFISMLEDRFLFLAADARSTLRGWRPTYRGALLEVRKKLNIPCSTKLLAEDLEVEIFLHLLQEYSREGLASFPSTNGSSTNSDGLNYLEMGLNQWKLQQLATLGIGATELRSLILKSGGMLTMEKLFESLAGTLSGKLFSEAAKYQIKKEVIKKGGQLAAINLESGAALLAARQGLKVAATRYLGIRSITQLLGPLMWGTLLADVVIQMLGTDYARILRAIYAFAQIRVYRSHKTASEMM